MIRNTLVVLALSLALFSGCAKHGTDDGNLQVFHGQASDDVKTWDPANAYDSISLDVLPSVYESLYQYAYLSNQVKVEPLLAADMPQVSADRLTITIPIKHGVKFQDDPAFKASAGKGREVLAQDFIDSWKRLALPAIDSQGWWIFDGKIVGINDFHDKLKNTKNKEELDKAFAEPIAGMKALDNYTIQLKLIKPYPQLIYILTMGFTAVVPHEAVAAYADEKGNYTEHPVGTGPFILKTWDRLRQIVLEKNPNYHPDFYPTKGSVEYQNLGMLSDAGKSLPFLDKVVINVIKEQQPAWLSFMKGMQDAMSPIPKDDFPQAIINKTNLTPEMTAKGVRLTVESGVVFYYISFNTRDKLIGGIGGKGKLLREALSSALDRDKWIEIFTNNTGLKMVTALPPGVPDRVEDAKLTYDYDLDRARDLLKKAGYPNGQGLPVINFDMRGASSLDRQLGEFITSQWDKIGVKLNVIYNTFPAYLEKAKTGNLQVSSGGWNMDYPDAENVYQLVYGPNQSPGPNESNFDHPEMNKLYQQMAVMESSPKRAAIVKKMDEILQEEAPWAFGYYATEYDLAQPWVNNYRTPQVVQNRYKYFRIDRDVKKRYMNLR
jgi:oligopeptide transport system substrate-binding protein